MPKRPVTMIRNGGSVTIAGIVGHDAGIVGHDGPKYAHRRAPWKTKESVELATLEWVSWFNHHRLLEPIGYG